MPLDPKWFEILKDSDDRLAGAAACGLFLLVAHWGWLGHLADWVIPLAWFGFLLFGCLIGVKLFGVLFSAIEVFVLWFRGRK